MDSVENELSFFSDCDEAVALICSLSSDSWQPKFIETFSSLTSILVKYQEQPILLNPSLGILLTPLTERLVDVAIVIQELINHNRQLSQDEVPRPVDQGHLHTICKTLHLICRVRGFKHVIKLFPHEVSHFELCITLLNIQVWFVHDIYLEYLFLITHI